MAKSRGKRFPLRAIVAGGVIILELLLFFSIIYMFYKNVLYVYGFLELISMIVAMTLVNKQDKPAFQVIWIIIIMIIPAFGGLIYLLFGSSRILPKKRREMKRIESEYFTQIDKNSAVFEALKMSDDTYYAQSRYIAKTSGYPVYDDTDVVYLSPGERILDGLLQTLAEAENYILIEFFILAEGYMWDKIHEILLSKAKSGVIIKIIFDDFGSIDRQSKGFIKRLKDENIEVIVFNPIKPSIDLFMNYRSHRKIVVVDGKTAVMGGFNIGDEYINRESNFGMWMDSAVFLRGSAARSATIMFLNMWKFITKFDAGIALPQRKPPEEHQLYKGFVQPYCDGPLNRHSTAEGIYLKMIQNAKHHLYITTPYLIVDDVMMMSLTMAARSGVDVRIITPKIRDKWYVHPCTQYSYEALLKDGVRIFEYTPGFMHAKMFAVDSEIATVGSINMDFRSFYFHFECGVWMYNTASVAKIESDIESILQVSEEIMLAQWKKRPAWKKAQQYLLHLAAPFF